MPAAMIITSTALESVRQGFFFEGVSVAQWARARGFEPRQVYAVLSGRSKGRFGKSHQIAVELGLKPLPCDVTRRVQPQDRQGEIATSLSITSAAVVRGEEGPSLPGRQGGCNDLQEKGG